MNVVKTNTFLTLAQGYYPAWDIKNISIFDLICSEWTVEEFYALKIDPDWENYTIRFIDNSVTRVTPR